MIFGKFFKCECGNDGLLVEFDYIYQQTFIQFMGQNHYKFGWRNYFKYIWGAILNKPYSDCIALDDKKLADLVDQLIEIQNRPSLGELTKDHIIDTLCGTSSGIAADAIITYLNLSDLNKKDYVRIKSTFQH